MFKLFKGPQRAYKTTCAVACILDMLRHNNPNWYQPRDVISDTWLNIPDYTWLNDVQMKAYLQDMIDNSAYDTKLLHKIIFIDEMDKKLPHWGYTDKEQRQLTTDLWQLGKSFDNLVGVSHLGAGIDNILRLQVDIEYYTPTPFNYNAERDIAWFCKLDNRFQSKGDPPLVEFSRIRDIQKMFDSWKMVKSDKRISRR